MADILIPSIMDHITPEWLTQIMARQPGPNGCRVVGLHIEDLNIEAGFISQLARLTLTYENKTDELPDTVIVKLAPLNDKKHELSKSLGHFQREVGF